MSAEAFERIQILLDGVKGLDKSYIEDVINKESDMTIVEADGTSKQLEQVVAEKSVDVVVTSLSGNGVPAVYQQLVFGIPKIALVVIRDGGHQLEVFGRKIVRKIGVVQLVDVIREVIRDRSTSV